MRHLLSLKLLSLFLSALILAETGCAPSVSSRQSTDLQFLAPPSVPGLLRGEEQPLSPEEAKTHLADAGADWFYGDGLGKSAASISTVVIFPPYAIYLVGNSGLQLFGARPLYVTNLLPERPREHLLRIYDAVTSVPGILTSFVAREPFRAPERLK